MKSSLLILAISIIALENLSAKTYYVSTSGVNTNSGLTPSLAWKTLTYAASSSSSVVAGDTVYVKAGNYGAEKVVFQKSGTAAKPIAFLGYQTNPGDAPPLLVNNANPYTNFSSTDMPLFDGGNRATGTAFNCSNQKYLIIKNFQIQNYAYGFIAGAASQLAGNLVLYNINAMFLGDINSSYSGVGILFGSMGTSFSNNNSLENCLVVNASAEGINVNGDNNILTSCKVYCNENTTDGASTDYYIIICGSYNTIKSCYVERLPGLYHSGHGISIKSNAEQVVDKGLSLPVINPQYNKILYCVAKNMGESFCVRHRGAQYNFFYHCKAIGTHTGANGSPEGEGSCIVTRDGASNNTFDGCIAENCRAGIVLVDSGEDGDSGSNPPGHPGNNNIYINCLIYNCYVGIGFNVGGVQSDAGDNTIANCTFYKNRYMYYASRHCANMKYIGNIYYGCLPGTPGGGFRGGSFANDIIPNGTNTYFKNCDFINIQGGMPANFVSNSISCIAVDPLLNSPSTLDFHLKSESPCKDASITLAFNKTDYDSILRPEGSGVDMGAYEYKTLSATLSVALSATNVSCNGGSNGSATVIASGGKTPYAYSWSNGKTTATSTGFMAGNYSVTVSDATLSSKTLTISITQPSAVMLSITTQKNVSCNGGNNGSATVVASGGQSPYTYSWSNGKTTATSTGLSVGSYTVTVFDANSCSKISTVSITQPVALSLSLTVQTNVSCSGGNNGSATVVASGGQSPYSYSWSNGKTTATSTGLSVGSYTVTVFDANSCSKISTVSITQPVALNLSLTAQTNVSCNGGNNGSATVVASGGQSPYSYSWSNGKTTATSTGLSVGSYTVTVFDANSCSKISTVSIIQPVALNLSLTAQTNVGCNSGNDGSATVVASGGQSPYTYSWSNGQTTATSTGLSVGSYTVTAFDANSCSKIYTVSITQAVALTLGLTAQTDVNCNGGSNGSATVNASCGKSPYTYSWSNGQTIATSTGLTAGSYTVTVVDGNMSSKVLTVSITQPLALTLSITAQKNVSCKGGKNGGATVSASGGKSPYTYSWSNGQTIASVVGLEAGTYTVTVNDVNACSNTLLVFITEPMPLTLSNTAQKNVSCNGGKNGNAEVSVSGGNGDYTYLWSPSGQTTASATSLPASDHTITVTDKKGCHIKKIVTIVQPDPIVLDSCLVANPTSCNTNDGSIRVFSSGGSGRYSHHWNTSPPQTTDIARGLPAGQYSDIIEDANGCSIIATKTVTCTSPTGIIIQSRPEGELNVFPNPATGPFNISAPVQQVGKPILVVVRDLLGKEYYSKVIVVSSSEEIFTIDPSGSLSPGVYLVIATSDDKLYERKIVVQ